MKPYYMLSVNLYILYFCKYGTLNFFFAKWRSANLANNLKISVNQREFQISNGTESIDLMTYIKSNIHFFFKLSF